MAGVEIAKAYVQIIPSMRGAERRIMADLGGITSTAGSKIGSMLGMGIGQKAVSHAKSLIVGGMASVAGASTAIIGTALTKGFNRLKKFEQAEQGLKGMKLSAEEIDLTMKNAEAAVKGTAFGLDSAATAAKNLVTANVKPGQELERVLRLIGDSAAQAGVDFDRMSLIWSKIYSNQKMQGDEAMQLMEAGIPIYQMVAKQMGITAEEARKMGEAGQISADMFADAIEAGFGGSALKMGETVSGSFANLGAALGRLGQGILAGPFADLPKVFTVAKDKIDSIIPTVKVLSETYYGLGKAVGSFLATGSAQSQLDLLHSLSNVANMDSSAKIMKSLVVLREETAKTKVAFSSLFTVMRDQLHQTHGVEIALAALPRVISLVGETIRGMMGSMEALAPAMKFIAQAAAIMGNGILTSAEILIPALSELWKAVGESGVTVSAYLVPAATAASAVLVPLSRVVAVLAETISQLPTPVLAVGVAFAALKLKIGPIGKVIGVASRALTSFGDETTLVGKRIAAMKLPENISLVGKMRAGVKAMGGAMKDVFMANLPMLGIAAAVAVFGKVTETIARNKQEVRDLAATFDRLGQATSETRTQILAMADADKRLFGFGESLTERLDKLGISQEKWISAAIHGGKELEAVYDEIDRNILKDPLHYEGTKNGLELLNKKYENAQEVQKATANALKTSTDRFKEQEQAIQSLIETENRRQEKLLAAQNAALAARAANRDYQSAVESARETIAKANATETEREAALDSVAKAIQANIIAARENRSSQEELNAIATTGKQAFFELGAAANKSNEELTALWNQIGTDPGVISATVDIDTKAAWGKYRQMMVAIDSSTGLINIDGDSYRFDETMAQVKGAIQNADGTVTIKGNTYPADMKLDALMHQIVGSEGSVNIEGNDIPATVALNKLIEAINKNQGTVKIGGKEFGVDTVLEAIKNRVAEQTAFFRVSVTPAANLSGMVANIRSLISGQLGTIHAAVAPSTGSRSFNADGSIMGRYTRERHIAQIAPAGAWRIWAEDETGGEAYIPLARSKRTRSTQILAEVARQFGYRLESYAQGGLHGVSPMPVDVYGPARLPSTVILQVGDRQMEAYVTEVASGIPGVQAANDIARSATRYRAQMGV
ncbi:tape measure protein [Trueperella sp. LYQ141]|uniref:tape measure protein n=1 Tax=Trueperella sp. LYQ141 TaxID=3391058 RepID=UPI0039839302